MASLVRRGEAGIPDLRHEIDNLFEQFFSPGAMSGYRTADFVPKLEVTETEDSYLLHAEVPGVAPSDVDIDVNNNILTLRGQKRREEKREFHGYEYTERSYGSFVRSIQLPPGTDATKIAADVRNGVLEVRIPKGEAARPRRIAVGGQHAAESAVVKEAAPSERRPDSNDKRADMTSSAADKQTTARTH